MVKPTSLWFSSLISSCKLESSERISSSSDIICSDYDISIHYMLSTPFEHQVYLGFCSNQKVQEPIIDTTYLGGQPLFLREPKKQQLQCSNCNNQALTFICQVFCPLQAPHCYNRILYIFYCERCRREFRCLKQQSSQSEEVKTPKIDTRTIREQPFYIESQPMQIKELQKIKNKAKRQVEEEVIAERQDEEFDSEGEQVQVKEIEINLEKLGLRKEEFFEEQLGSQKLADLRQMSENMHEDKKQEKDAVFQQYRRVMKEIDDPVLLYSNISILYNNQPVNPRHTCKHCKSKLSLQLQITQKMLLVSPKLIDLDWGCLLVFTCANSCQESAQECIVIQYEVDAVQDSQITVLKKRNKNKKRKEKSQQKKEQNKSKQKRQEIKEIEKEEEGDWD